MRTAEGKLKIFKFTNVVPDYQIDSIFLAFNLKKKWGLLIHLNSVVCCYIFDQISCVNKVQSLLHALDVFGDRSCWIWIITMLQAGCRGCLVDVGVLYFL